MTTTLYLQEDKIKNSNSAVSNTSLIEVDIFFVILFVDVVIIVVVVAAVVGVVVVCHSLISRQ